jgi:CubicO group peptidase (beta-lactamase class C family)
MGWFRVAALLGAMGLVGACTLPEWAVENPRDHGLDTKELDLAVEAAEDLRYVRSLTVTRSGELVVEAYYWHYEAEDPQRIQSVTKSVLSALTGIAIEQGALSMDDTAMSFFPEYDSRRLDPRVHDITVDHLVHMRAGFPNDQDSFSSLSESDNWIQATLEQTLVSDPGEEYRYSTFSTHLLSGVLTKAIGAPTADFAQLELCGPVGIRCDRWRTDPQGIAFGGSDMELTAREMALFGDLYLTGGVLRDGTPVVPADWVADTTQSQEDVAWAEWGDWRDVGYGGLWWTGSLYDRELFFGLGHGGQYIIVDRDWELVITTNSDWWMNWDVADIHERAVAGVIAAHVLPAVVD